MTPANLLRLAVNPAHEMLEPLGVKSDARARVLSLAIAGQESVWTHRLQIQGPARSFWQFEQGGGVRGVLNHPASTTKIAAICDALSVACTEINVYGAMAYQDVLAAAMARLLLYTDPAPLPAIDDVDTAWSYYCRTWRPGLPHRSTWAERYLTAKLAAGVMQ